MLRWSRDGASVLSMTGENPWERTLGEEEEKEEEGGNVCRYTMIKQSDEWHHKAAIGYSSEEKPESSGNIM